MTLDDLDPPAWGPPPDDATPLVRRAHELRTTPVADLGIDDLRMLISQDVARDTLIPIALGMLRHDPLVEGDHYPGDLLMAVLRVPDAYWYLHPDQHALLRDALAARPSAAPPAPPPRQRTVP